MNKETGEPIKQNGDMIKFLLDSEAQGMYAIDLQGTCTFVDPSCLRLLGYTDMNQLLGRNMHYLIHHSLPDGSPIAIEACRIHQALSEGKGVYVSDEVLWRADGSYFPAEYWSYPQIVNGETSGAIVVFINTTEYRVARDILSESCSRFQGVVETLYDCVWEIDPQGHFTYISPQIKKILGYDPQEMIGTTPFDRMPPEESKRITERFNALVAEQSPIVAFENINLHKDGHPVVLETNGLPFYDVDGNLKGYRGTDRDITKRKRTEAALIESEKRFSIFMEHLPAGVFIKDSTDHLVLVNRYLDELFGWKESIGKTTEELMHHEMAQRMIEDDRKVLSRGPMVIQERIIDKHGRERFFDTYKFPIRIEGSDPLLAGIAVDITKRLQAERESADTKLLLQSAFSQTPVPMILVSSPEGMILNVNQALIDTLGLEGEENDAGHYYLSDIEHTWENFDMEGNRIPWDELPLMLALKGITTKNREMCIRLKDGTKRCEIVSAAPIYNSDGEMIAAFAVFPDITDRKRIEEALEKRIVALTRPLDASEGVAFEDLFNIGEIQNLQDMLADTWGAAILLTRPDGTPITKPSNFTYFCSTFVRQTEKGARNCQRSDAMLGRHNPSGPIIQPCLSAGLWSAGASITAGGYHIANWLVGQVRNKALSEEKIMEYAREIDIDEKEFREAFLKVPVMSKEKFNHIAHTLFALANQLSMIAYQNIQQARSITDLKQTEEALSESEKKLLEAQKLAQLGYWTWDVKTGDVTWSEEIFNIFRLDPKSFTPHIDAIQDLSPWPEDHNRDKELIQRAIESREKGSFEQRFLRPDKSIGYYFSTFQGKYDDNGDLLQIIGTVQDITERKRAENALIESEKRFRAMTDTSPLAIYMSHGIEQKAEYINPTFTKLFGYTIEEVPSASAWFPLAYPDEAYRNQVEKAWSNMVKYAIQTRSKIEPMESIVTCKDGTKKHISWGFISASDQNWAFGLDVTESKEAEKKIRHMATHDGLTDLPTLRLARDRLDIAMGVARRKKMIVAVMFADLDGFKEVNDTYGHDVGDEVLREAAQRFRSSVRETDTVARIGGDEFLIVITELQSPGNAAHIAQKVIQSISQPIIVNGKQTSVGTSIGIALYPRDGCDIDSLIKLADEAMYRVKNSGRNNYTFANWVGE
ncbi:MAG TPA: PAS domain S-box protein [Syntrophales bacterium]|nr:PAS domain S-box protein [Syntrophales bacterium]